MPARESLKLAGITKSWRHPVLKSVDLSIDQPGIYTILGVNGAGKTTLLRTIFGLVAADSGTVETPERVAFVPDTPGLYSFLTGREYLRFAGQFINTGGTPKDPDIEALLSFLGLEELDDVLIGAYSNGMKQKLSLAAALLADPTLLLLDEPLTGVDLNTAERIRQLLRELSSKKIIVLTTHILELAHSTSDAILFLDEGVLSEPISPKEVTLEELRSEVSARLE